MFSSFSYQDVTEEVAEIVNEILDSVYTCSFQVNIVKTAIESVVMAGGIVGKTLSYGLKLALAAHSVDIVSSFSGVIDAMFGGNKQSAVCANPVKAANRSRLQLALMGL